MDTRLVALLLVALLGSLPLQVPSARAQAPIDSTFSYQGRLWDQGEPASGLYDFRFRLFDAASGGAQAGPTLERDAVFVDQGIFTVELDFGPSALPGEQRWLELELRAAAAPSPPTVMLPRTLLATTPYALGAAVALPGSVSRDSVLAGAVGAGQIDPAEVQRRVIGTCPEGQSMRQIRIDGSVECGAAGAGAAAWLLGGNDNALAGRDFLGTLNSTPLELRVANQTVARFSILPVGSSYAANVVLGSPANVIDGGVRAGTISGGGLPGFSDAGRNRVTGDAGTVAGGLLNVAGPRGSVGGGQGNYATGSFSIVAGGENNQTSEFHATIAGGKSNRATDVMSSIGGGSSNIASGLGGTVAGGLSNTASGRSSGVGGGELNCAGGAFSWAGGRWAKVRPALQPDPEDAACRNLVSYPGGNGDQGTFIWADSQDANFVSTGPNQFLVRAAGGVYFGGAGSSPNLPTGRFINTSTGASLTTGGSWSNASSRVLKTGFEAVDPGEILARLARLPILRWTYRESPAEGAHLGPVAEDFHQLFGLGADAQSISTVDASGVALAAIQGLHHKLERENGLLREQLSEQQLAIEALGRELQALRSQLSTGQSD